MGAPTENMLEMITCFDQPEKIEPMIEDFYAANAVFQDPIQKVEGREGIKSMFRSFAKLFKAVDTKLLSTIGDDKQQAVHWEMTFVYKSWPAAVTIKGVTWLEFNDTGQCVSHTDYWDLWAFFKRSLPFRQTLANFPKRLKQLFS